MNAGPGHSSGGGGGRSRRRRGRRPPNSGSGRPGGHAGPGRGGRDRQQQSGIFTAPMDHNYRNNGGSNGSRAGGRGRAGFGPSYIPADPDPLPKTNEDASSKIFAFVDDLFFAAKIQETARKLNVKVEFVKSEAELQERIKGNGEEKPSLIIFDMNNANAKPLTLIPKLKIKTEERDVDYRLPVACAGGFEAEGSRSGMRYGAATVGVFAELAEFVAQPWRAGRANELASYHPLSS